MKFLVAYYSNTGTTKLAAEAIAKALGADIEAIAEKKPYPPMPAGSGNASVRSFARAGIAAMFSFGARLAPSLHKADEYDVVVIGTPVWIGSLTPPVRSYIRRHRMWFRSVAFFCTAGDPATCRAVKQMTDTARRQPLATLVLKADDVKAGTCEARIAEFAGRVRSA